MSDLHFHYFLIRGNHLVTELHEHLKGQVCSLHRESRGVNILGIAIQEILNGGVRLILRSLDSVNGAVEDRLETAIVRFLSSGRKQGWDANR